ncbi:thioredoxin family protein [Geomicrobium sp. JSM 1781026]|uniref:thioredoxin family protein n=1 Tax=Geomicrobium sp. JSM 1781026 TaxID=3344580 RepID=UPI0035C0CA01
MLNLNEWYEQGMSIETYIQSMQSHKENLQHIYERFAINESADLEMMADRGLRTIVITEDWCGDAMVNMPILMKIGESTNMKLSILQRDQNLELMDQYLTNGKSRSIPIFIFLDEQGNEFCKWGPRAEPVQRRVDELMAQLPDKESPTFNDERKKAIQQLTAMYRENEQVWDEVFSSIMETLKKA